MNVLPESKAKTSKSMEHKNWGVIPKGQNQDLTSRYFS